MKKALITGITGQDGAYLVELLLDKEYEVHGIVRRSSSSNTSRIDHLLGDSAIFDKKLFLHYGDLSDGTGLSKLIEEIKPDEIYNLGAQSHVRVSFDTPEYTGDVTGLGSVRILEAIRESGVKTKYYQASSSELYGLVQETPQTETTPFYPRSPYAVAKLYSYWIVVNYRESYDMYATNGILFNHESPRRGETFVTRKITLGLADIVTGQLGCLYLGNLDAKRDWGYAKDYVEGMWRMLQQEKPGDYVLATGETHSVREFIEECCKYLNIDIEWSGAGMDEVGIDKKTGKTIIRIDAQFFRPAEVELLLGNPAKAKKELGWTPKTTFKELAKLMMESDLEISKNKALIAAANKK